MQLNGSVVLISGASEGIGAACAAALRQRGATISACALPGSRWELPVDDRILRFEGDITAAPFRQFWIDTTLEKFDRIDGLINNAGRSYAASLEEIDPVLFDEIFHLNVLGPIVAIQSVIPIFRRQGAGSIVNINSGTAFMTLPK